MVEGTPLLREHTPKKCIEGSNPSFSARQQNARKGVFCWAEKGEPTAWLARGIRHRLPGAGTIGRKAIPYRFSCNGKSIDAVGASTIEIGHCAAIKP